MGAPCSFMGGRLREIFRLVPGGISLANAAFTRGFEGSSTGCTRYVRRRTLLRSLLRPSGCWRGAEIGLGRNWRARPEQEAERSCGLEAVRGGIVRLIDSSYESGGWRDLHAKLVKFCWKADVKCPKDWGILRVRFLASLWTRAAIGRAIGPSGPENPPECKVDRFRHIPK